ncbi:MAG: helix-turn-helix transcriptional regulator [Bacillota bacterium]|nr:helix-turn-helix transcriptional regulator [Bacillota bacterium]
MSLEFPRIITLLRNERRLSQKSVANALGISQALLSHYEKGIRECKLEFLVKIADYYNVSVDYLLGRTEKRNYGQEETAGDPVLFTQKDNVFRGSVFPALGKALTASSINVLFDLMKDSKYKSIATEMQKYFAIVVYKLFRHFYRSGAKNPPTFFAVRDTVFESKANAALLLCEQRMKDAAEEIRNESSDDDVITYDLLKNAFPKDSAALLNFLKNSENEISKLS